GTLSVGRWDTFRGALRASSPHGFRGALGSSPNGFRGVLPSFVPRFPWGADRLDAPRFPWGDGSFSHSRYLAATPSALRRSVVIAPASDSGAIARSTARSIASLAFLSTLASPVGLSLPLPKASVARVA